MIFLSPIASWAHVRGYLGDARNFHHVAKLKVLPLNFGAISFSKSLLVVTMVFYCCSSIQPLLGRLGAIFFTFLYFETSQYLR
jgi:hypothetical protein